MWQSIFFYLSNHHCIYSASGIVLYRIPPWSIVSDLSLAGFLNTLLEVFSHRTALYTNHLPVSPWGFPEKEQRLCNGFPKHQQSPLDTATVPSITSPPPLAWAEKIFVIYFLFFLGRNPWEDVDWQNIRLFPMVFHFLRLEKKIQCTSFSRYWLKNVISSVSWHNMPDRRQLCPKSLVENSYHA